MSKDKVLKLQEMRKKLKEEVDKANWEMLAPHHERGAVFTVSNNLDLDQVGASMALDDSEAIKSWLDRKDLKKLEEIPELADSKKSKERTIPFLIIAPYVLIDISHIDK